MINFLIFVEEKEEKIFFFQMKTSSIKEREKNQDS